MIMHPLNFSTPYSLDNFVIEIFLHLYYQETFMEKIGNTCPMVIKIYEYSLLRHVKLKWI